MEDRPIRLRRPGAEGWDSGNPRGCRSPKKVLSTEPPSQTATGRWGLGAVSMSALILATDMARCLEATKKSMVLKLPVLPLQVPEHLMSTTTAAATLSKNPLASTCAGDMLKSAPSRKGILDLATQDPMLAKMPRFLSDRPCVSCK